MVGRCISYWNSPFLGDMLFFMGVILRVWNFATYPSVKGNISTRLRIHFFLWNPKTSPKEWNKNIILIPWGSCLEPQQTGINRFQPSFYAQQQSTGRVLLWERGISWKTIKFKGTFQERSIVVKWDGLYQALGFRVLGFKVGGMLDFLFGTIEKCCWISTVKHVKLKQTRLSRPLILWKRKGTCTLSQKNISNSKPFNHIGCTKNIKGRPSRKRTSSIEWCNLVGCWLVW